MTLGEKITTLRNSCKMSQGDLAEKLNVSRQSVSKWETGVSTPELDKLISMSELFNITIDELVKSDSVSEKTINEHEKIKTTNVSKEKQRNPKQTRRKIFGILSLTVGVLLCIIGIFLFKLWIPGSLLIGCGLSLILKNRGKTTKEIRKVVLFSLISTAVICLLSSVVFIKSLPIDFDSGGCAGGYKTDIFYKYSDELVNKFVENSDDKEFITNAHAVEGSRDISWDYQTLYVEFYIEYDHLTKGHIKEKLHFVGKRVWTDTYKWVLGPIIVSE